MHIIARLKYAHDCMHWRISLSAVIAFKTEEISDILKINSRYANPNA